MHEKNESTDQMQMRLTGNCICSPSAYITVSITHSFCPALPPQAQTTLPAWLTVSLVMPSNLKLMERSISHKLALLSTDSTVAMAASGLCFWQSPVLLIGVHSCAFPSFRHQLYISLKKKKKKSVKVSKLCLIWPPRFKIWMEALHRLA